MTTLYDEVLSPAREYNPANHRYLLYLMLYNQFVI